jgi:hypothetical protein
MLSAVVALAVAVCATLGAFGLPLTDSQENAVQLLIMAGSGLFAALWARRRVTPLADPQDNEGRALVALPRGSSSSRLTDSAP